MNILKDKKKLIQYGLYAVVGVIVVLILLNVVGVLHWVGPTPELEVIDPYFTK